MDPLQPLCRSVIMLRALKIAKGMVLDRTLWPKHNDKPMNLAVAFRRVPHPSEEDLELQAELSALGKPLPKDLIYILDGFHAVPMMCWDKSTEGQQIASVQDGDIGAVAFIHSCPYDDHLIVEVTFRDSPESCMHTALPFGDYVLEEDDDPKTTPPRMYMETPWMRLYMETDTFLRHPVLPRRFVPRSNTRQLWQRSPRTTT